MSLLITKISLINKITSLKTKEALYKKLLSQGSPTTAHRMGGYAHKWTDKVNSKISSI